MAEQRTLTAIANTRPRHFSRKKRQRPVCWPMSSGSPSRRPRPRRSSTKTSGWCVDSVRSVRRDAIQRDALLARPDIERRSGDRGLRYRAARAPVTDVVARRAGQAAERRESWTAVDTRRDRGHGDNRDSIGWRLAVEVAAAVDKLRDTTTLTRSTDGGAAVQRSGAWTDGGGPSALNTRQSLCYMLAVTFSFRFGKGHPASQNR